MKRTFKIINLRADGTPFDPSTIKLNDVAPQLVEQLSLVVNGRKEDIA